MKLKWLTLSLISLPAFLFSLDKSAGVSYSVNSRHDHEFGIQTQFVHKWDNNDLFITPRTSFTVDGNLDATLGIGFRRYNDTQTYGVHASWDTNHLDKSLSHQVTVQLEAFLGNWSIRSNNYFPITNSFIKDNSTYTPIFWMDNSVTRKFKYFSTSLGSVYDFKSKTCDIKADFFVPIQGIVIGVHGNYPINGSPSAHISLSFGLSLSGNKVCNREPVVRNSKVRYCISSIPKDIELPPDELQVTPVIEDDGITIVEVIESGDDEISVTWWEWFKGFFNYDNSNDQYGPKEKEYYFGYDGSDWGYDIDYDLPESPPSYSPNGPGSINIANQASPVEFPGNIEVNGPEIPVSPSFDVAAGVELPDSPSSISSDVSLSDISPDSSFNLSFDPSAVGSSPSVGETPFSDIGSPSSWDPSSLPAIDLGSSGQGNYGAGGFYDVNRSDSSPSDNGWTSVNH